MYVPHNSQSCYEVHEYGVFHFTAAVVCTTRCVWVLLYIPLLKSPKIPAGKYRGNTAAAYYIYVVYICRQLQTNQKQTEGSRTPDHFFSVFFSLWLIGLHLLLPSSFFAAAKNSDSRRRRTIARKINSSHPDEECVCVCLLCVRIGWWWPPVDGGDQRHQKERWSGSCLGRHRRISIYHIIITAAVYSTEYIYYANGRQQTAAAAAS